MSKRNVLPEGTRDIILDECVLKRKLEKDLDGIFEKWGYKEVITPTVEYYETFNQDFGTLKEEDMYKFFDNKGRILVLRPDMTVPIARVVETKLKDSEFPIQLRYNSNIFRVHKSLGGKRNEYTDAGIELIGLEDVKSDVEVLVLALESMEKLGFKDFKLELGNSDFINGAFENGDFEDESKSVIAKYIDEKNMKSLEEYLDTLNIDKEYKDFFNKLPWLFGEKDVLKKAEKLAFNNVLKNKVNYLQKLYDELDELGYGSNITFDLGMIPRLNYYTGIIFKGYCEGVGTTVLRGGRYDNLIRPNKKNIPAIGFSIDINSVIYSMDINKTVEDNEYILFYNRENKIKAIKESQKLRKEGKVVQLLPKDNIDGIELFKKGEV